MNTEDGSEALHPWIEPEIEARLTALVLGEASDFERDELERLVAERPELELYQKRLEVMHRMLRDVAKGESAEDQGEWKLAEERREALLAKLGAEPDHKKAVVPIQRPKSRSRLGLLIRIAACVAVVSLFLGLMWPASTGVLRKVKSPADGAATFAYELPQKGFSDRYGRNLRTDIETTAGESITEVSVTRTAGTESLAAVNLGDDFSVVTTTPAQPGKAVELRQRTQSTAAPNATSFFSVAAGSPAPQRAVEDLRRGLPGSPAEPAAPRIPSLAVTDSDGDFETRDTRAKRNEAALGDLEERELRELDRAYRGVSKKELRDESRQEGEMATVSGADGSVALGLDFSPPPAAKPSEPASVSGPVIAGEALVEQKAKVVEFDGFIDLQKLDESKTTTATTAAPAPAAAGRLYFAETGHGGAGAGAADKEANGGRIFGSGGTVGLGVAGDVVSGRDFAFVPVPDSAGLKDAEAGKREKVTQLQRLSEFSNALANDGTNAAARRRQEEKEQPVRKAAAQEKLAEVKRESTGDWGMAPVGKAPIDESVDLGGEISAGYMSDYIFYGNRFQADEKSRAAIVSGTVNFGAGVSQIENLEEFQNVGDANVALPGLRSDEKRFRFNVRAGSERKDAEVAIDEPWTFGRAEDVDQSVADIMALTPQIGQGASAIEEKEAASTLNLNSNAGGLAWGEPVTSGDHVFTRQLRGGADTLRGFDYRDVGPRNQIAGTRSGNEAISAESIDDLIAQAASNQPTASVPWSFGLAGVAVDSGFDDMGRKLGFKQPTPAALDETSAEAEPFSTFSLHVSDVSFQLAKAALASGQWPEAEKIRIEEFVNAFDYGDPMPGMGERVSCRIDQAAHPFLQQRNLVRIALRTAEAGRTAGTPLRLTLLLDSSGSMERPDRRATLTRAVATLAGLLGENDRITLVSFARQPRLVADAVPGNEATKLAETVAALPSEGGTNLEAALQLAFEKAREHREPNAQNRIVLLTDGAANLGDAKAESLGQRVELMRESGIAFDAAGFGAEGLNDEILEALTRKGDGRYYLLDRPEDAGEAFAEQIAGALRPAAKNVKVQVEFNPDRVKSYKLLGFEKHLLATEDFRNDAVDAAEMAAAEAGVAVYQVEPDPGGEGDLGSVSVRFRDLDSGEMIERRWALPHLASAPSAEQGGDAILLATVASQFAAILAGGPLGDVVDLGELARLAAQLPDGERVRELRTMIEQARGLVGGF